MKYARLVSLLLAVALLGVIFAACDTTDPAMKAAAGTYVGEYTKLVGDETKTEESFQLTLKADGTGAQEREGIRFNVTWTLEGENFTMTETFIGDPVEYTGTLKDGKLHLYNGDPEYIFTREYFYTKQ